VRLASTTTLAGGIVQVPVILSARGTENALGFSLSFDPSKLRFLRVLKPDALSAAMVIVNSNQLAQGKIGLTFGLPIGSAFGSGTQPVLSLQFAATPDASGTTALSFGDVPILRETVTITADTIASSYTGGTIDFGPMQNSGPPVHITRSGEHVVLHWEGTDSAFALYGSASPHSGGWTRIAVEPFEIGGQKIVSLPLTGDQRYFRLQKP
jgi:hypothetical protein